MALLSFRYEPMRMKLKTKLLNVVIARYAQKRPSETEMPRIVGLWNGLITAIIFFFFLEAEEEA